MNTDLCMNTLMCVYIDTQRVLRVRAQKIPWPPHRKGLKEMFQSHRPARPEDTVTEGDMVSPRTSASM